MLTVGDAFYELRSKLQPLYDEREATAVAHELLHHITGLDKTQRLMQKETLLTEAQQPEYDAGVKQLLRGKPLQYVTGSAWFLGREFYVNESVLIPRPETEELVQWMLEQIPNSNLPQADQIPKIFDVGTGSGCIAVSLKLALPGVNVSACDISGEALAVARENAKRLSANINLMQLDFLDDEERNKLGGYDVIVSNPPYIPAEEKARLHTNVRDNEPALALFVPDNDALVFYRAIAKFGKGHLNVGGRIYCELDAAHAEECKELFEHSGYKQVEIKKDIHGNWRFLRAG